MIKAFFKGFFQALKVGIITLAAMTAIFGVFFGAVKLVEFIGATYGEWVGVFAIGCIAVLIACIAGGIFEVMNEKNHRDWEKYHVIPDFD